MGVGVSSRSRRSLGRWPAGFVLAALLASDPSSGTIRGDAAGRDAPLVPPGVVVVEGVSTAWCAPGQTLLGGGYDLALGEPAPPPAQRA